MKAIVVDDSKMMRTVEQRALESMGWEVTQAAMASLSGTADTQEGVRAFLEKRPPVWTGR